VALLAQRRSDIDTYRSDRFTFAREHAHVWFDILEDLERREKGAVNRLKADMNGVTLIGEYIGAQEHQHLVKYSRVTIIFYAVVSNDSDDTCWPCEDAFELFDKYNLDKVHIRSLGLFSDFDKMCDTLVNVFREVAKA
jgi:ATP-dependent RNA circularization protein (DNA/RNA ligase family)